MKITPKMLKDHGACHIGYRRFKRRWPDGVTITRAWAREAAKMFESIHFVWAMCEFLHDGAWTWSLSARYGDKRARVTPAVYAEIFWRASRMEDDKC